MLQQVQDVAQHMPAIGEAWLTWLENDESKSAVEKTVRRFPALRQEWASWLTKQNNETVNPLRVASNLATAQLAWATAEEHPEIGPILKRYHDALYQGLAETAQRMTEFTAKALEGKRFIETLRQLVASDRVVIRGRDNPTPTMDERDRLVGWFDADGVYLSLELAVRAVEGVLGPYGLGSISERNLCEQLHRLGLIRSRDETNGRWKKLVRIDGKGRRLMHLVATALEEVGDDDVPF